MALEFIHVKLLKYTHTPVFFEAGLRYRIEKKLTISGRIADNSNPHGVHSLFSKEGLILDKAVDYDDIILNGVSFGNGRIDSIEFTGGDMARKEDYTYEITCYESGNLFNGTNGVYAGIVWTDADKIESLTETLEYEENDKGDKTYTHSISVQFSNYSSVADGNNKAKALASVFFNATSGLGSFLGSYSSIGGVKRLYAESYNLVDCSCSFTETVSIPSLRSGNYSYTLNYSVELGQDGFVTVSEKCDIVGLTNPRFAGATEGMNALSGGAFGRCNTVYGQYHFSSAPLFTQPIEKGVSIDKYGGRISLQQKFSNDPRYQNIATWEYTLEAQMDAQGYYTVSESGEIQGYGRPTERMTNSKNFYNNTVKPGILARVTNFYQLVSGRSMSLIKTAETRADKEYEGSISYSQTYTDNNTFSNGDIRKAELSITISKPVHLVQNYPVFNQKEVVQPQNQATLGTYSYQIKYRGKRGTQLSVYLGAAKTFINTNLPPYADRFIESVDYELNPISSEFSMNLVIKYAGVAKDFADIKLD